MRVRVAASDASVVVELSDDGIGGADPAAGTGLRGLADRVETLGGSLDVASPAGAGTTLWAEIHTWPKLTPTRAARDERMPQAAIGVLVAAQAVDDSTGRAVLEQAASSRHSSNRPSR